MLTCSLASTAAVVSTEERLELIRRARVWAPVDVPAMDLLNGPGPHALGAEVRCRYEEKDPGNPLGGHAKKFPCHDASGKRLKVKYDPAGNPEVFGEVAGARLFWALGFPAERMSSVKLVCENCPADPWVSSATPRATRTFEPATLQERLPGKEISETEGEGWTFGELELIDEAAGGSPAAHVDALKLLAVFANHGDNTANQQRLLCPAGDEACKAPLMYATDLGGTFGGAGYYASFRNWSRKAKIWKDAARCVADFKGTTDDFRDPEISEAGRAHLAGLLSALSDKQVRELFLGARFDVMAAKEPLIPGKDGKARKVTVDDWVRIFNDKRRQIVTARCPK